MPTTAALRVVVADDDAFTASLVADALRSEGFLVATAATPDDAWEIVVHEQPHAIVSDLNFGHPGTESGASLLARADARFPWIGLLVLTSHLSPVLAVDDPRVLPERAVYLVKSRLHGGAALASAVRSAIAGGDGSRPEGDGLTRTVTESQAEVLRMLAAGASTKAIAERRGTSVRAAETMLTRLYEALGILADEHSNPRVAAVAVWREGRVVVRGSGG